MPDPSDPGISADLPLTEAEELVRLRELVACFYQLNRSLDLRTVLHRTLTAATGLTHAAAGSIALISEDRTHLALVESTDDDADSLKRLRIPLGQGILGHVAATGGSVRVEDAASDPRFYAGIDDETGRRTGSYLCVPLVVDDTVIGTAQLMNWAGGRGFTASDEALMEGFARQAALAIHNARMVEVMIEQQAIRSELEVCATIQRRLFPASAPPIPGFRIHAASVPCREVGGDYYTFVDRGGGSFDLVLADVSGKGLPAAMIVSDLHAAIHLLSPLSRSLETLIGSLDEHLRSSLPGNKFVTLFAARVAADSPWIDYVVAGHPAPFLVAPDGRLSRLEPGGPVLGVIPGWWTGHRVEMTPGSLLVAFTDGYSEAASPAGDELGEAAVGELVAGLAACALDEIVRRLAAATDALRGGAPAQDDDTLLLLRRTPDERTRGSAR